jgi:flavin-dependent dehydrogenase
MLAVDVVIVGAGPAGATAALNLAPFRRVLLVDRLAQPADRLGHSLAPAARRLLGDMGLWADFLRDGHSPWYVARSVWGTDSPSERDSLADLDGNGWQLDRKRFEARLRRTAVARGATLLAPANATVLDRSGPGWILRLQCGQRALTLASRLILDCGGRSSCLLKPFGVERRTRDRLLCGWIFGTLAESSTGGGLTYVESAPDGWWYTSPLADGRRVLAWHTDADLPAAAIVRSRSALLEKARRSPRLMTEIADVCFGGVESPRVTAAHSSTLTPPAGEGWLAAGDAALSFDPLSSQGLFHALYTGLASAEAAERTLRGDVSGSSDYVAKLAEIDAVFQRNLRNWYELERRWPHQQFWRRRAAMRDSRGLLG